MNGDRTPDLRQEKEGNRKDDDANRENDYRVVPKQCDRSQHQNVFAGADGYIRKGFRRTVHHKASTGFQAVRRKTHRSPQQRNDYFEYGIRRSEGSHCQKCAPERANYGVNGVPNRIDPRDLVREELKQKKNPGNNKDDRISKDRKRCKLRRKVDPPEMDRESRRKYGQIKAVTRKRR